LPWDPINPALYASVGMILYLAHRYDEALAVLRQGVEMDPSHYVLYLRMGLVYQQKRQPRQAVAAMQRAATLSDGGTEALAGLAQSYASAGHHAEARRIEGELTGSEKRYVSPYNIARIFGSLAEPDRALEWLVKAYEEHNPDLIEVTREPTLQILHGNLKFRELTRRIGWLG
jgi:tetratricopeptide (TPR) repeat protein